MSSPWLPLVTSVRDGWRVTPIWRDDGDGPVLAGFTVFGEGLGPLTPQVLDALRPAIFGRDARRALAAAVYTHAHEAGVPPTKAVAAALGMTVASAYNLVVKLRRDGLLPQTTPGKTAA